ncbi:MAG TPA: hypothetical protein DDW23_01750 [Planctomycetes bacterium]|jgi:hypothetical protein|nr:hypothetical protein [Planctomycetota bacterium]|tara:strand:- start:281 stop:742 length:462 start_codon:yes stop_codon:yes gene_type:complete
MKVLIIYSPLLLILFLLSLSPEGPASQPIQEPAQEEEVGPLEERMLVLKRGMRSLRRSLKDPEKDAASLDVIVEMQKAVAEGKLIPPPMVDAIPKEGRDEFVLDYRKLMILTQQELLKLEMGLLENDRDSAKAAYDALKAMEDAGHERFTEDG